MLSYLNMEWVVRLKDGRKIMLDTEAVKFRNNERDAPDGDFDFMQWKTDLNKELFSFWNGLLEK